MDKDDDIKINSFLTFKIGEEEFGANVHEVLNILELQDITKVPKSPEYMKGVINLRGTVLPVIDTRIKLKMPPTEFTSNTCIVVLDLKMENEILNIGALVDSVVAVRELNQGIIEPSPSIGNSYRSEFISGVAKVDEKFIMILDLIKLFTSKELEILKENQTTTK